MVVALGDKTGRANYVLSSSGNEKKLAENFKGMLLCLKLL